MTPVGAKTQVKEIQLQLYTYFGAIRVQISPQSLQTTCSFQLKKVFFKSLAVKNISLLHISRLCASKNRIRTITNAESEQKSTH